MLAAADVLLVLLDASARTFSVPSKVLMYLCAGRPILGGAMPLDNLFDSPPVLPVTDALVLSGRVDATLVVCVAAATTRKDAARATELLQQIDAPLCGHRAQRGHRRGRLRLLPVRALHQPTPSEADGRTGKARPRAGQEEVGRLPQGRRRRRRRHHQPGRWQLSSGVRAPASSYRLAPPTGRTRLGAVDQEIERARHALLGRSFDQ